MEKAKKEEVALKKRKTEGQVVIKAQNDVATSQRRQTDQPTSENSITTPTISSYVSDWNHFAPTSPAYTPEETKSYQSSAPTSSTTTSSAQEEEKTKVDYAVDEEDRYIGDPNDVDAIWWYRFWRSMPAVSSPYHDLSDTDSD